MPRKRILCLSVAAFRLAGCFSRLLYLIQPRAESKAPIKKSDIGSVVTSPNGPEVPG